MYRSGVTNHPFDSFKRIISNDIGFVHTPCISENTKTLFAAACEHKDTLTACVVCHNDFILPHVSDNKAFLDIKAILLDTILNQACLRLLQLQ